MFCKIALCWAPTEVSYYSKILQKGEFKIFFLNKDEDGSHGDSVALVFA